MKGIAQTLFKLALITGAFSSCYLQAQTVDTLAFTGARLIDGSGNAAIENGVLIVSNGRVSAIGPSSSTPVPADAVVMDLSGNTIMPGIINAHGHTPENPDDMLEGFAQYGITTVVSLGGEEQRHIDLRDSQDTPALVRSRIYVAGPVLNPQTPAEARSEVSSVAAMGVDWVKIRVNSGDMPEAVYRAVIEQAHAENLRVAAHMLTLEDTKGLLRNDVDLLAHSIRDFEADQEVIAMIREAGICLVPTLTREVSTFAYAGTPDFFDNPFFRAQVDDELINSVLASGANLSDSDVRQGQEYLAMAQRNLKLLDDAGLDIAMGTDSGASPGRFIGFFEHLEMALMADAGMSPMDIIHASTGGAAACMGLEAELGTLAPGKWADFLVLSENPLTDIRNTQSLESVWIAGNRVD